MAEPLGMDYVATEIINDPATGARAYNPGDLVHESAVVGDAKVPWIQLGINVEVRAGASVSRPPKNAPHAAWVEFAVAEGCPRPMAEEATRKELIRRYGEDATAADREETGSDEDGAPQGTAGAEE
jgi:hypothetical protein